MVPMIVIFAIIATCLAPSQGQISGSASPSLTGGTDINLSATKFVGKPDLNVGGQVFASSNTKDNTPTLGATGILNVKDHSLSLTKSLTPGVSDTFSQNARVNLLKNDNHRLDANLFNSHTKLQNGFEFDKRGGSLDYNHAAGHGLSLGASHIPNFGTTGDLSGRANLWRSNNGRSTFDLTGSASRTFSGPFAGRNNFGGGLLFNHRF